MNDQDEKRLTSKVSFLEKETGTMHDITTMETRTLNTSFHALQNIYEKTRSEIENITQNMNYATSTFQKQVTLTELLSFEITHFDSMTDHVAEILAFARNGLVHPGIISGPDFEGSLSKVASALPPGTRLLAQNSTLDYIRKMTASVYDAGSVVRVELELPFVYDTKYTIMEFRPIISRSNVSEDLALMLNISRDLYIMDFEDKNYFNLRQADLNSVCNIYSPAVYTCSNLEPTLKPIAGECFLNQLFGSSETESKPDFGSCPTLALRLSKPIFYKMADGKSLLYQAPKQVLSKVQCREPVTKTISISLFDKGIITINSPHCSINASGFIFAPSTINSDAEMFPLRDIIGQGFKIDFPCWVTDRLPAVPSRHTGLVRDASELTDFAVALHDLERSQENDGYIRYINFAYQSSWTPITMMGLLIVILIAMGAVVAFRRKKPTAKLDLPPPLV
ncbi:Hypothetical protein NTJ_03347 [Nesidiocoris tenuis]|uniref:Uncharacterized protein n=2 Tax=Nesidiocoris tenuis TaxID=355587 RepID=A0ABN7AE24_9HEMI|nr:Hypothetical protein NTJ_03347 [Nesidiocoris tenuis]